MANAASVNSVTVPQWKHDNRIFFTICHTIQSLYHMCGSRADIKWNTDELELESWYKYSIICIHTTYMKVTHNDRMAIYKQSALVIRAFWYKNTFSRSLEISYIFCEKMPRLGANFPRETMKEKIFLEYHL